MIFEEVKAVTQRIFEYTVKSNMDLDDLEINSRFNDYMHSTGNKGRFIANASREFFKDPDYLKNSSSMKKLESDLNYTKTINEVTGGHLIDAIAEECRFINNV